MSHVPLVVIYPEKIVAERVAETTSTVGLFRLLLDTTGLESPGALEERMVSGTRETDRGVITEYTLPNPYQIEKLGRISPDRVARFARTLVAVERDGFRLLRGSDGSKRWATWGIDGRKVSISP